MCMCPCSYLISVDGGLKSEASAKQDVIDISKFLYLVDPQNCNIKNVVSTANVIMYLNRLRTSRVGPSGQIKKLTAITSALSLVLTKLPDDGGNEEDHALVVRAKAVETKIKGIQCSLRKESKTILTQKEDMFYTTLLADQATLLKVLRSEHLQKLIESYIVKDSLTESSVLLVRRFLTGSLLFCNAHRQGAVVNLCLHEQRNASCHTASWGDDVVIYKVREHKTNTVGSVNLVALKRMHSMINRYIEHHRPHPLEGFTDYVFLTLNGQKVEHLAKDLRALLKR